MSNIATVALPFFGLVFLGYAIGRWGPVRREFYGGLDFFLRAVALPALTFRLLAVAPRGEVASGSFILTTTFATYCAFAIAFSFAALLNRGRVPEATVEGLAGSHSAAPWLAPALVLAAFGASAGVPMTLIIAFDALMLTVLTPLMMALAATERLNPAALAKSIGNDLLAQPFLVAAGVGFLWSMTGLGLPGPVNSFLGYLSAAAIATGLFAFGLMLSDRPVERPPADVGILIVVKLVIHPLIVWLLLSWIAGFDRIWVATAVLVAALPPGSELLAAAQRYRSDGDGASLTVLWGSLAAIATLIVVLVMVLADMLPADPFR